METQYLKTLLMAAEEGSFSRAALKLNVTQSAVSQRTKSLEACCGVTLLDRSGATLQPTVAGQVVIEGARRILAMEERMMLELRSLGDMQHLHVCCTPAFGMTYLPQILETFMPQHSKIDDLIFLFATPLQALDGLRSGEFDVVIFEHLADFNLGALRHVMLPSDEMVFVSAPRLEIPPGEVAMSVLHDFCFIIRRVGCSCRDLLSRNLASLHSDIELFRRVVVLDDFSLIIKEVLAGNGFTFISRSLVEEYLVDGRFQEHHVAGFECVRQRSIVTRECEASSSLKRSFMESVMGYFNLEI
ncbi:MAG: LysR family transcriptional regulator [Thermodesulfobacteriota bacterium]|nr:LysR family transcriptional regulator [Thermodesulfobacteriota bacterium]